MAGCRSSTARGRARAVNGARNGAAGLHSGGRAAAGGRPRRGHGISAREASGRRGVRWSAARGGAEHSGGQQ